MKSTKLARFLNQFYNGKACAAAVKIGAPAPAPRRGRPPAGDRCAAGWLAAEGGVACHPRGTTAAPPPCRVALPFEAAGS